MATLPIAAESGYIQATGFADVSGMAWIRDDLFLVIQDAKNPETLPRACLLEVPTGPAGIFWKPLDVQFPEYNANDLEGIARIPGTDRFILAESTEELAEKPYSGRLFLGELRGESLEIIDLVRWPLKTENIEGTAIARVGERLLLLFAERAHGRNSTGIHMADLRLSPLRLEQVILGGTFTCPYPCGENARPVSAIAVDASHNIYVASAEDPDDDNGPFASAVYSIGKLVQEGPVVTMRLDENPRLIARLDGMKVEGLTIRERSGKPRELFVGLDDENYGGTVRPIRLRDPLFEPAGGEE